MPKRDTHGARRKAAILAQGLALWRATGSAERVSARAIGKALDLSHSAILYHYGTSDALRNAVAVEAVRLRDRAIVRVLVAQKHPAADTLGESERRRFQLDIP